MTRKDQFIPEIFVLDGPAAMEFYKKVFGAEEVHRMMAPDGRRLMHGEITLDGHRLFVCNEFLPAEGGTCKSPQTLGGTGVRITLEVEDADAVAKQSCSRRSASEYAGAGCFLGSPLRKDSHCSG